MCCVLYIKQPNAPDTQTLLLNDGKGVLHIKHLDHASGTTFEWYAMCIAEYIQSLSFHYQKSLLPVPALHDKPWIYFAMHWAYHSKVLPLAQPWVSYL